MSRTKFADLGSEKALVRMPDGTKEKTEYAVAFTVKHKGKRYEVWAVSCKVNFGIVDKPLYMSFDRGFVKGGIGLYLPSRRLWLFKRTEKSMTEFRLLCKEWFQTHFGSSKLGLAKTILSMTECENRKEARKALKKGIEKYGLWEFGLNPATRTKGLQNLLNKSDNYSEWLELNKGSVPRIAWKI